jgi:hypothetical protein
MGASYPTSAPPRCSIQQRFAGNASKILFCAELAHCEATMIAGTNGDLKIVRFFSSAEFALQPEVAAWRHLLTSPSSTYSRPAFIPTTY